MSMMLDCTGFSSTFAVVVFSTAGRGARNGGALGRMMGSQMTRASLQNWETYNTIEHVTGIPSHPCKVTAAHFDGLVQERRNCNALAMELGLSFTDLSILRPGTHRWNQGVTTIKWILGANRWTMNWTNMKIHHFLFLPIYTSYCSTAVKIHGMKHLCYKKSLKLILIKSYKIIYSANWKKL